MGANEVLIGWYARLCVVATDPPSIGLVDDQRLPAVRLATNPRSAKLWGSILWFASTKAVECCTSGVIITPPTTG